MDRFGGETCFRVWRSDRYRDVSYRHFRRQTLRLTHYLRERRIVGDRVALWAPSSPEWMIAYLATLLAGGVVVPLRRSLPRDAIVHMLEDSGARIVVVDDDERARRILEVGERLGDLDTVITIEDPSEDEGDDETERSADRSEAIRAADATNVRAGEPKTPEIVALSDLVADRLEPGVPDSLRRAAEALPPATLAAIHYTTTQTGEPLGAVFDHGQRRRAMENLAEWFELDDEDVAFTALPWGYVPSLEAALHYFVSGVPNVLSHSRDLVFEEIQQASPTLVLTIPNALERAYDEVIDTSIRRLPESTQEMFFWALATGKKLLAAGTEASQELRERYARADRTFFSAIRGAFGGRFRRFVCTGAPLQRGLAESIQAIGLVPVNVYSLTESGGFPAVHPGDGRRPDTCGPVAPGFEMKLAEDGEVLVRGDTVMREYWRRPDETAKALDEEGWLRTSDYGELDEEGHLVLTGRVGETILLSTSRRVDPGHLERMLEVCPFVHRAAVFGEGRPYVVALIVPDLDVITVHLRREAHKATRGDETAASGEVEHEAGSLYASADGPVGSGIRWFWNSLGEGETVVTIADPRVEALLDEIVHEVNDRLDEWERIERYALVGQQHSVEAAHLVEVLDHDRAQLAQAFADEVQSMYPKGMRSTDREITQVQVGPERLRELLEKESILDAWTADAGIGFLLELAREHGIDTPSVIHICDAAANVAQMENEEKPLSTALIVGDPLRIHRVVPTSLIQLHRHEHIRRMRSRLADLSKLVDGLVLAYIVDRHGYVRGIGRLDLDLDEEPRALFGPQFRRHAEISRRCDSVVFFVPKGGRQVRVFAKGQLVGRYSNGDWSSENASLIEGTVDQLTSGREIDPDLASRVLRCAFRMSEENLGAIFMLGDAERVLAKSDRPEINRFAWISSAPVASLSDEELINFAQQDGATVIDAETGRFRSCMVLLRPDAATRADVGEGKGARHSSAAKMSAETESLAITVSQDGPITVYDRGQRILSL